MRNFCICLLWALVAWNATPSCFRPLYEGFFEPIIVQQGFDLYNVSVYQSQWGAIIRALHTRVEQEAEQKFKERGRLYKPNPFNHPIQVKQIRKLFEEVMYDLFAQTLREWDVTDPDTLHGIFTFILSKKQADIDRCLPLPKEKKEG